MHHDIRQTIIHIIHHRIIFTKNKCISDKLIFSYCEIEIYLLVFIWRLVITYSEKSPNVSSLSRTGHNQVEFHSYKYIFIVFRRFVTLFLSIRSKSFGFSASNTTLASNDNKTRIPIKKIFQKSHCYMKCIMHQQQHSRAPSPCYLIWCFRRNKMVQFLPYGTTISIILRRGQINGPLKLTIVFFR